MIKEAYHNYNIYHLKRLLNIKSSIFTNFKRQKIFGSKTLETSFISISFRLFFGEGGMLGNEYTLFEFVQPLRETSLNFNIKFFVPSSKRLEKNLISNIFK